MTYVSRVLQQTLMITAWSAAAGVSQQPTQFKANVRMKNGSDGTTATGTMYFGGTKTRTELTMDGQSIIVLADQTAKSQVILMPSDKVYMQTPIGQGPISVPIAGPSDPTNPCTGASGNTDCVKGPNEAVNGYDVVRWDYTSAGGVRTRAWVSSKLRFPVKVQDDNGSAMEFNNIAEGPQAASLFGIPTGYKRMDIGALGGIGSGATASKNDPISAAMASMSPEAAAALAAGLRGDGPRGAMGQTGSGWEKAKGWVINLTVTGTASTNTTGETYGTRREIYTARIVTSVPLNYGTPAAGVPGTPGPTWQLLAAPGMGSPEALATPITFSVETDGRVETTYKGACGIAEDPYTSVGIIKGTAQKRGSAGQPSSELGIVQGLFKISADLRTYDLMASIEASGINETTDTKIDAKSCRDGKPYTRSETTSATPQFALTISLKDLPLPSAVGPVSGSKKMPMGIGGHQLDATVSWTIAPIR